MLTWNGLLLSLLPALGFCRAVVESSHHGALNELLRLHDENTGSQHNIESKPPLPEQYFTQKLDHFDESEHRTWSQRYFADWEFYKAGGPVLLMIGGEGPISDRYLTGAFVNHDLAKRFGGVMVAVEHRFYGKSQPLGNLATENLRFLRSQQALADLAAFSAWFDKKLLKPAKWFCLGGSYPGSLAAWYRQTYPDRVAGCIAASAPVFAKEDFYEYGEVVWRALSSGGNDDIAEKLHAGYMEFAEKLSVSTPLARQQLLKDMNACPYSVLSDFDRAQAEDSISGAISGVVQYNNSQKPGYHIEDFQDAVRAAASPFAAAIRVTGLLNATRNPANATACMDYSLRSLYEQLSDINASAAGAAGRSWFYQTCNEFGFFQTMRAASLSSRTLFTRGAANPGLWQELCEWVFEIPAADVAARIQATNQHYGALNPTSTRVLFTNGEYDPWSALSIKTQSPAMRDQDLHTMIVEHGSHCAGLYSSRAGEPPAVEQVHAELARLFAAWGAEGNETTAADVVV